MLHIYWLEQVVFKCVRKGEASRIFVGDRVVSHFGIRTPGFRFVVPGSGPEFHKITESLGRSVELSKQRATDAQDMAANCLETLAAGFDKYEALMVMQYTKGVRVDEWLRDHDGSVDGCSEVARMFRRVGRLAICDMLIDNSDRFMLPGVWDIHTSNTGNAMVGQNNELLAIDHDLKYADRAACDEQNRKVARILNACLLRKNYYNALMIVVAQLTNSVACVSISSTLQLLVLIHD